jgi:radical SAM modification target selenobiotic family peptide
MDIQDLKKYLAGFGIAGLIAGAGLVLGGNAVAAESSCTGKGTAVSTEQTSTQSSGSEMKAEPESAPTPTSS